MPAPVLCAPHYTIYRLRNTLHSLHFLHWVFVYQRVTGEIPYTAPYTARELTLH